MKRSLLFIICLISALIVVGFTAEKVRADSAVDNGAKAGAGVNPAAARRAYPGGRDDSDLSVQVLRKLDSNSKDQDPDEFEADSIESGTSDSGGFGE